MAVRIPWDEYEVAYLLKACIDVDEEKISRTEAISNVSAHLRQRARMRGMEIDDIFRNENGISMQYSALHNCFHNKNTGLTISRLFRDIVSLYKNDRAAYERILEKESQPMDMTMWQRFLQQLERTQGEKAVSDIKAIINMLGILGRKNGILKTNISQIEDLDTLKQLLERLKSPGSIGIQSRKTSRTAYNALSMYCSFIESFSANSTPQMSDDIEVSTTKTTVEPEVQSATVLDASGLKRVDFAATRSYAHTKPSSCSYKGQDIPCHGWNALYLSLVRRIYAEHTNVFPVGKNITTGNRIDTGIADDMIYPKEIANGLFLECNISATGIVSKLRAFMDACGIQYDDVIIHYRNTSDIPDKKTASKVQPRVWTPSYLEQVQTVLNKYYAYGFRTGSPIELMRFRNFADREQLELPQEDNELTKEISNAGITIADRVYVFSNTDIAYIKGLLEASFSTGARIIFIEPLKGRKIMFSCSPRALQLT